MEGYNQFLIRELHISLCKAEYENLLIRKDKITVVLAEV